jgi:hypothetical protein
VVQYKLVVYIILAISLTGCSKNETTDSPAYQSSFESLNDTAGWIGISPLMFINEGGKNYIAFKKSASGPAASMEVNILNEGNYKLSCTGKSNLNGGYICLKNSPLINSDARCIYINSAEWTTYSSSEIYCPANSRLVIEIFAGGDIPSDLYLDEISLTR